jgi:hypothetical protein
MQRWLICATWPRSTEADLLRLVDVVGRLKHWRTSHPRQFNARIAEATR